MKQNWPCFFCEKDAVYMASLPNGGYMVCRTCADVVVATQNGNSGNLHLIGKQFSVKDANGVVWSLRENGMWHVKESKWWTA